MSYSHKKCHNKGMFIFRIREIRVENHLSLETLSKSSSVNLGYLSQLERGEKQNPSMDLLYKIACALGVNIKDLFYTIDDINELKEQMYSSMKQNGISDEKTINISNLINLLVNLSKKQ